ncbi:ATP-grasp domain-containing protein [Nocardia sp. NPDC051570]|uniref:ATP-grasp domain-containing protein n=1 Tax=Nocardia sp. NPDC051570 TaxID=3364324 RepID=UPI0037B29B1B
MNVAAIVDPLSTGAFLADEFASRGWRVIAVMSTQTIPDAFVSSFRPSDFDEIVIHEGDLDKTLAVLSSHTIVAVVAGTELGVELADALSEALGCPGNGTALSSARRDKFEMVERVRAAGLLTAKSIVTDDVEKLVSWASDNGLSSIVVKPVASAGCDSVSFCHDSQSIRDAFAIIQGNVNSLGMYNSTVLGQELLIGEQYFVNSISRNGRHYISEIWHDRRQALDDRKIFDYDDLLPADGDVQHALVSYVKDVLDALGIGHGPAHTELMLTEAGPVLIETAARMQGAIIPSAHIAATGHSQVSLTVDSIVDPSGFDEMLERPYAVEKHLRVVWMLAPFDGEIAEGPALAELLSLPTVVGSGRELRPGTPVRRTLDLFTTAGYLYLAATAIADIERDLLRIRQLESDGLYRERELKIVNSANSQ